MSHTLKRTVLTAVAALAAALAIVPSAPAATGYSVAPTGPLHDWTATGNPAPDAAGASFTTPKTTTSANFAYQVNPTTHGLTLSFDVNRSGVANQTLAAFPDNKVFFEDRKQGVLLRMPNKVVSWSSTPLTANTWHHVALRLDIEGGTVTATVDGRSVAITGAALKYDRYAQVGDKAADAGGPYTFRGLNVNLFSPPPSTSLPSPTGLFAQDSVWNAPLADNAPIDSTSPQLIAALNKEIDRERSGSVGGPWLATSTCAPKTYTVPAGQPTVPVALENPTAPWRRALAKTLAAGVPIPSNATPTTCQDSQIVVLQPSTDTAWEFHHMFKDATGPGWHAQWGGVMRHVSTNPGYFTPDAYPGATYGWGASASSLPLFAGVMKASELQSGVIKHALTMSMPEVRALVQAWPAQRNDGRLSNTDSLPEGAHLRLPASLNLDAMNLPPATLAMAKAAQKYGIIIRDVTHKLVKFDAENINTLGYNPYPALLGSASPLTVMRAFPWAKLQVLQMDLRQPAI